MKFCRELLKLDQRNFHCWNHLLYYYRKVESNMEEMFSYSKQLIKENPSNYSAWHMRGEFMYEILCRKYADCTQKCLKFLKDGTLSILLKYVETDQIVYCLSADSDDQCLWYYLHTLLSFSPRLINRDDFVSILLSVLKDVKVTLSYNPNCIYYRPFVEEIKNMLGEDARFVSDSE